MVLQGCEFGHTHTYTHKLIPKVRKTEVINMLKARIPTPQSSLRLKDNLLFKSRKVLSLRLVEYGEIVPQEEGEQVDWQSEGCWFDPQPLLLSDEESLSKTPNPNRSWENQCM